MFYLVAPTTFKNVFALFSAQSAKNFCPVKFNLLFKCNLDVIIPPRLYLLRARLYSSRTPFKIFSQVDSSLFWQTRFCMMKVLSLQCLHSSSLIIDLVSSDQKRKQFY